MPVGTSGLGVLVLLLLKAVFMCKINDLLGLLVSDVCHVSRGWGGGDFFRILGGVLDGDFCPRDEGRPRKGGLRSGGEGASTAPGSPTNALAPDLGRGTPDPPD